MFDDTRERRKEKDRCVNCGTALAPEGRTGKNFCLGCKNKSIKRAKSARRRRYGDRLGHAMEKNELGQLHVLVESITYQRDGNLHAVKCSGPNAEFTLLCSQGALFNLIESMNHSLLTKQERSVLTNCIWTGDATPGNDLTKSRKRNIHLVKAANE